MPHYQILRCEANQEDCSYSWDVKLTEFGYCISNKIINNLSTGNWANSIYFSFQHMWTYCFPYGPQFIVHKLWIYGYFYLVTVMLVTSLCWWLFSLCWWFFQCIKSVTNMLNPSPTSQTCHQHIWSPTSVTNIHHQHQCHQFSSNVFIQSRRKRNLPWWKTRR